MSFLFNYAKSSEISPDETIDKLCDMISSASLIEDRRGAVFGLKGLTRDYKLVFYHYESDNLKQVGTKGMNALINVLKTDQNDVDILKATLETLNILCTAIIQNVIFEYT